MERLGVFVSAALVAEGFLTASDLEADLGVSGLAVFADAEGRVRGESTVFLTGGVPDLETS